VSVLDIAASQQCGLLAFSASVMSSTMAKKRQPKSGTNARRGRPRLHQSKREYFTPEELLGLLLKLWRRLSAAGGGTVDDPRADVPLVFLNVGAAEHGDTTPQRRLAIITAGIVTGAKLLIRLSSHDGSLEMTLQPTVEYSTEKASDELAESLREQMIEHGAVSCEQLQLVPSAVFGEDNPKELTIKHLQLVHERTNWRWVHPPFDPNVDGDEGLREYLSPWRTVMGIAHDMVEALLEQRALVTNHKLEMISEYIAAHAAAKYCLSLWGNRKRAAIIEYFAELGSEALYDNIMPKRAQEPTRDETP
jgi:hypothetical protein